MFPTLRVHPKPLTHHELVDGLLVQVVCSQPQRGREEQRLPHLDKHMPDWLNNHKLVSLYPSAHCPLDQALPQRIAPTVVLGEWMSFCSTYPIVRLKVSCTLGWP